MICLLITRSMCHFYFGINKFYIILYSKNKKMSNFWGLFLFEKRYLKNKLSLNFYFIFSHYEKIFIVDWYHRSNLSHWLAMISSSFCIFIRAYLLFLNNIFKSKPMDFNFSFTMRLSFTYFIFICMLKN